MSEYAEYTPEKSEKELEALVQKAKKEEEEKKKTALIPMGSTAVIPVESRAIEQVNTTGTIITEEKTEQANKIDATTEYELHKGSGIIFTEEYLKWRPPVKRNETTTVSLLNKETGAYTKSTLDLEQCNNIDYIERLAGTAEIRNLIDEGKITNREALPILMRKSYEEVKSYTPEQYHKELESRYKPSIEGDPEAIFNDCLGVVKEYTASPGSDYRQPVEYAMNWLKIGRAYTAQQEQQPPAIEQSAPSVQEAPPVEAAPVGV